MRTNHEDNLVRKKHGLKSQYKYESWVFGITIGNVSNNHLFSVRISEIGIISVVLVISV